MKEYFNDKQLYANLLKVCGYDNEETEDKISFIAVQTLMENYNIPINEVFRSPIEDRFFIYYQGDETKLFTVRLKDFTVYAKDCTEDEVRSIVEKFKVDYPGYIPTPDGYPPSSMLADVFSAKNTNSTFLNSWTSSELTHASLMYYHYALSLLARFDFHENVEKFDRGEIDENEFIGYAEKLISSVPKAEAIHKRRNREFVRIDLTSIPYALDFNMSSNKASAELPFYETVTSEIDKNPPSRILVGEGETFNEAIIALARLVNDSYDIYWNAV